MAIKATSRGGSGAGRGDDPYAADYAKRMGVPQQWVTGPGKAKFSGSIAGFEATGPHAGGMGKGNLFFTAESTGGGATDSHLIPFRHPSMNPDNPHAFNKHFGVNTNNPSAGKKWVAEGRYERQGLTADSPWGMNWSLRPHDPEYDD